MFDELLPLLMIKDMDTKNMEEKESGNTEGTPIKPWYGVVILIFILLASLLFFFRALQNVRSTPSATGLAIGARIKTTDYLNVRTSASLTAPTLGVQSINAMGTITVGPTTANGYTWWNVDYDSGPDGWSVQNWMVKI